MRALLSVLLLLPCLAFSQPQGVYSAGWPTAQNLVNDNIDGFLLRIGWKDVEPVRGQFDWSRLDQAISQAKQANKKVTLAVITGHLSPDWLLEGTSYLSYNLKGKDMMIPPSWDAVYLYEYERFISEFGLKYNNNETVSLVHMTISGGNSFEMHFHGMSEFETIKMGYTPQQHVSAWKRIISAYNAAFPNKHLDVEVHPIFDNEYVAENVVQCGKDIIGERFGVFAAWWSKRNIDVYPVMHDLLKDSDFKSAQLGGDVNKYGIKEWRDSMNQAAKDKIDYIEVWPSDEDEQLLKRF